MSKFNKTFPALFKKSKTGAIQEWQVSSYDGEVQVVFGQVEGLQQTETYTAEEKNVGRSNHVGITEQAFKEAEAKWVKQKKKGYVEDPSGEVEVKLPPLAKKYQDAGKSIKWPAYVSAKLDGLRCTVFYRDDEVVFQTRGGETYPDFDLISDELWEMVFRYNKDAILDGELYCHGMCLEDIVRACKTKKHTDLRNQIKFYVFDYLEHDKDETPLYGRVGRLSEFANYTYSMPVSQELMTCESAMLGFHKTCVDEGLEGVVIRNTDSLFKFNYRTSDFQKYKVALDAEFKVVGMKKNKQGGGVCICEYFYGEDHAKDTFSVNFKGTKEQKKDLWDNQEKYIGKWLTVEFEKLSKYGKPTKGIGKFFRDCDEKGEPRY